MCNSDALFSLGRATEVTRDEVKFAKFISRIRGKFGTLFIKILERQLVLKQIMSIEDFQNIAADIKFEFAKDNYFSELKDAEVLQNRAAVANDMTPLVGKYYSNEWLRKNVLHQTDDDIEENDKQIEEEVASGDPRWMSPEEQQAQLDADSAPINPADAGDDTATDPDQEKLKKMYNANATYNLLSKKQKKSDEEKAKYSSAAQILAKNK